MSEDLMLKCLIAFILGWFLCKQMGNGFSVGVEEYFAMECDLICKKKGHDDGMCRCRDYPGSG